VRLPVVNAYDDEGNVVVKNFILVPDVVINVDCYGNMEHKVLTFVLNGPGGTCTRCRACKRSSYVPVAAPLGGGLHWWMCVTCA
jgi:hypothetical protein